MCLCGMTGMIVTVNLCVFLPWVYTVWLCERWKVSRCKPVWDSVWAISVSLSLYDLVFLMLIATAGGTVTCVVVMVACMWACLGFDVAYEHGCFPNASCSLAPACK